MYAISYGHVNSIQSVFVGDQFSSEAEQVSGEGGRERRREGGKRGREGERTEEGREGDCSHSNSVLLLAVGVPLLHEDQLLLATEEAVTYVVRKHFC